MRCWRGSIWTPIALTGKPLYRRITEEILDFIVREMRDPNGGFYSTQDADSEGVEGKFYVWERDEFLETVGEDGELLARYFNVTDHGNWEHHNILNVPRPPELFCKLEKISEKELESKVAAARQSCMQPVRSASIRAATKRFSRTGTAWRCAHSPTRRRFSGATTIAKSPKPMPSSFSRSCGTASVFFTASRMAARDSMRIWTIMPTSRTGCSRFINSPSTKDGFDVRNPSPRLIIDRFGDEEHGGFYFTARDHEELITRTKDFFDNATPSGNSVAADVLLRLAAFLGRDDFRKQAEQTFAAVQAHLAQYASGFGRMLAAVDFAIGPSAEIALVGGTGEFLASYRKQYLPRTVIAAGESDIALLRGRKATDGKPTAFICENLACKQPVTDVSEFEKLLGFGEG